MSLRQNSYHIYFPNVQKGDLAIAVCDIIAAWFLMNVPVLRDRTVLAVLAIQKTLIPGFYLILFKQNMSSIVFYFS